MSKPWFSEDVLEQMSRPTMDRAIEALDRGDVAEARGWRRDVETIASRDREQIVHALVATGMRTRAAVPARIRARLRSARTTRGSRPR